MQSTETTLHKALITIKKLKALLHEQQKKQEPIAIVGLSCRYPQADNKNGYWQMLVNGTDAITQMPEDRWQLLASSPEYDLYDATAPIKGGFLNDIASFDAYFFGISPREAAHMDPQQRLLLEVAYEAFEDAGCTPDRLAGSNTGVFASLYPSQIAHLLKLETDMDALYIPTGNAAAIAANRISYLFDLRGPSLVLDTSCSSSLVALHIACLHLQNQLCATALVCAAHINLLPSIHTVLAKAKMLAPDGRCKTFSAEANGYAQGEGVGAIILKPLSKAISDHDRIYAVIMGEMVNQDGKTNGLTAPNGLQQEALLRQVYAQSGVDPLDISYVECHGTGTFLGDPIEVEALGNVLGKHRTPDKPCWIGSVKTNMGHLEPASGIASIIKVALALQHQQIPPHLNAVNPNPHIAFSDYHFHIPKKLAHWSKYNKYRSAGISGFGFGGTNAHVILREFCAAEKTNYITQLNNRPYEIFTLSAKDPGALSQLISDWCVYLATQHGLDLAQLCHNVHLRRAHYPYRLAIVVEKIDILYKRLCALRDHADHKDENIYINVDRVKAATKLKDAGSLCELDPHIIAKHYIENVSIDWSEYENSRSYEHLDMPLYPWQRKKYWPILGDRQFSSKVTRTGDYPIQAQYLHSPLSVRQFSFQFDTQAMPEIKDTYNVLHAGYYLEMIAFALNDRYQRDIFSILDMNFILALIVPDNMIVTVHLILEPKSDDQFSFVFYSQVQGQEKWLEHVNGNLSLNISSPPNIDTVAEIRRRCRHTESVAKLYEKISVMGMPTGASIRWTHQYWYTDNEILCELKQPDAIDQSKKFRLNFHPGLIDGCIQPIFKLLPEQYATPFIAAHAKAITFFGGRAMPCYLLSRIDQINEANRELTGTCYILDQDGRVMIAFEDFCLKQLEHKIQADQIAKMNLAENLRLSALTHEDRKRAILQFLVEQIATIFSMPLADVDVNRSLIDMGMDSLMGLVLLRTLEIGLGVNYSVSALMSGPTIMELVSMVLNDAQYQNPPDARWLKTRENSSWIAYRVQPLKPKMRLFCFPYGGAGASIYRDWQQQLPDGIEVCPIQLPGRENRLSEKSINQFEVLIRALIDNLHQELTMPFAFFGHSFGALIAFELARALRALGLAQPEHIFASAFPDPRLPTKKLDHLLEQLRTFKLFDGNNQTLLTDLGQEQLINLSHIFNESGIVNYGEHLLNHDVVKTLLPIFFGDMGIIKSYHYRDDLPLAIPITVFLGKRDTWVPYEDHLRWVDHTQTKCEIHEFDGDHLFIKDDVIKKELFQKISNALKEFYHNG